MGRLLYEESVSYKGYLIIPFVFGKADKYDIFSYKLLSAVGYNSKFHKVENPATIYGSNTENVIKIAKEHLDLHSDLVAYSDAFRLRYTYRNNLIIVFNQGGKYFYDHYPSDSLNNIAAPKLFRSEYECLQWIKEGLDRLNIRNKIQSCTNQ
ncbi:MAG: hypothetical protein QNJ49_08875 [Mastigocoleus sp. MO_167.B18]|nr:hypothetical protein [Mastigocoleus sp. MO_167.B18]